ncbi:type IV pilin protein [Acholeplasma equifetale]|uniref:type IV pilin protein n=1 Tax=Acholeplasma equifetale TaxID=264634 RepID=UPI00047BA0EA|nr:prepilin-type N-terminal cleavage/methylation domain-containing protein [Acholeplasma equifetale]
MKTVMKKGFTLVELIVVIAIIAVLSTVSIVGYSVFIESANKSKANQELVQIENVMKASALSAEQISVTTDDDTHRLDLEIIGNTTTLVFSAEVEGLVESQLTVMNDLLSALLEDLGLSQFDGAFTVNASLKLQYESLEGVVLESAIAVVFAS